ncbi:hypothetical protein FD722_19085 [Photobacterium damselae subsp. damselae]|nr:hypothetical protein FD719_18985 [Photobacterium damselae subsp. damselae]TLS86013.1 hypothetical protein FD722_19085 [Photobacterium damselae subsp. damselae]
MDLITFLTTVTISLFVGAVFGYFGKKISEYSSNLYHHYLKRPRYFEQDRSMFKNEKSKQCQK